MINCDHVGLETLKKTWSRPGGAAAIITFGHIIILVIFSFSYLSYWWCFSHWSDFVSGIYILVSSCTTIHYFRQIMDEDGWMILKKPFAADLAIQCQGSIQAPACGVKWGNSFFWCISSFSSSLERDDERFVFTPVCQNTSRLRAVHWWEQRWVVVPWIWQFCSFIRQNYNDDRDYWWHCNFEKLHSVWFWLW